MTCTTHHICDCQKKRMEEIERKLQVAREALELFGRPDCDALHHRKEDRHQSHIPCPVAGKIMKLTEEIK